MEKTFACKECNKIFNKEAALNQHNAMKHSLSIQQGKFSLNFKGMRKWIIGSILIGLFVFLVYTITPKNNIKELNADLERKTASIPAGAVHWHPRLTIKINGERINIPAKIGMGVGKVVDTSLSGMQMSPTHTHETDGTIHLENNNPNKKPETLTLGYFFYVWDKQFDSSCIFEYCTDKGELKIYINEEENTEFRNYIMKDKDEIRIEYTSKEN